ncbi:hypothetical protein [Streptomyces monashensis]|uniref:Uncharacterized protein n=1 Tax=Streptomyces monashensis TaxID=1678012 RepID=A0A1S2Q6X2_9ACTN|nr:hypothetical protein [Streptomyces monashensis]OIK01286.1 hypothetical protein BIV23_26510 [Streptomyces monashensis]
MILVLASGEHRVQIAAVCVSAKFVDRVRSAMLLLYGVSFWNLRSKSTSRALISTVRRPFCPAPGALRQVPVRL